ncbi:MAG: peroxide stress protein YaaA [Bernardetiaceae bacterium]|nr:peroxide stress protein YaaA [Bernardetiaceae bacterium]
MIFLLSPSKTQDFETPAPIEQYTDLRFSAEVKTLTQVLSKQSPDKIASLMKISEKLAILNFERFQSFEFPFTRINAKQAVFAFQGDVYDGLDAQSLQSKDYDYLQNHLRIISGLYGLLRPLDLIQPYRLEMKTPIIVGEHADLYKFWDVKIANLLLADIDAQAQPWIINLASQEYFKAIPKKTIGKVKLITPQFKEIKDGKPKIIAVYAKKARGQMVKFAATNNITNPEDLKAFDMDRYQFSKEYSTEKEWVFVR